MSPTGSSRRRLTTAVAVALAAACVSTFTTGGTAAATATTAVSSSTTQQGVASLLPNSVVIGHGATGFLTAGGDMSGDGRPDLLATDKTGVLWLYKGTGSATAPFSKAVRIGGGWGVYNKITATGNIGGGPAGDLIARDTSGELWLYLGKGDGTFTGRTRIDTGWDWFHDIVAVGDANRDGRNDLVVSHRGEGTAGRLFLFPGTGDWRAPFSPVESVLTSPRLAQTDSRLF